VDETADYVIGCLGGGSNFGGTILPFVRDKINGKTPNVRCIAVESKAAPKMTKGKYLYDYGDSSGMTPLLKMFTIGHSFIPAPVHAGGLRYHGCAPTLSYLLKNKVIEGEAYPQLSAFKAADLFAKTEGLVPAPETSHAIKATMEHARKYPENGGNDRPVIVFTFSGHGLLDLFGYEKYFAKKLENHSLNESKLHKSLSEIPDIAQN
ncbi:MAG: pyridoxal-phosphate dependent enzyme, partial [Asgard group archaeon]|nr:pyridoxal-phosphate dependent enzyme [Asgard group archaeon]